MRRRRNDWPCRAVRLAEAAVIDAAQRLRILGVTEDIQKLLDDADLANTDRSG